MDPGLGHQFERVITGVFGSSNARYVKKLQGKVDAVNALEPTYSAMSDEEALEQFRRFQEEPGEPILDDVPQDWRPTVWCRRNQYAQFREAFGDGVIIVVTGDRK